MIARWRTQGARLRLSSARGLDLVTLENHHLRVTVAQSKGGEVIEFVDKANDVDICWFGERGPVPAGASFTDSYTGGWQEVFPSGGTPGTYRGAPLDQHAEAALLPWELEIVTDTSEQVEISLRVVLRRLPFTLEKRLRLGADSSCLEVSETATNLSPTTVHAMWGQHLAFGAPFLRAGSSIRLPPDIRVLPHPSRELSLVREDLEQYRPVVSLREISIKDLSVVAQADAPSEMLYLSGFAEGWYELDGDESSIRVEWDAQVMPYLWFWQEFGASEDYPFWGTVYVLGLEPFSSMPTSGLSAAVANGTALQFQARETKEFTWSVRIIQRDETRDR